MVVRVPTFTSQMLQPWDARAVWSVREVGDHNNNRNAVVVRRSFNCGFDDLHMSISTTTLRDINMTVDDLQDYMLQADTVFRLQHGLNERERILVSRWTSSIRSSRNFLRAAHSSDGIAAKCLVLQRFWRKRARLKAASYNLNRRLLQRSKDTPKMLPQQQQQNSRGVSAKSRNSRVIALLPLALFKVLPIPVLFVDKEDVRIQEVARWEENFTFELESGGVVVEIGTAELSPLGAALRR
jgi:hypothetical protein